MLSTDRKTADAASELLRLHGAAARAEAVSRALVSRDRGNVIHFCHWRQVARAIELFSIQPDEGTIH
jgi:hypothetical protein